jgi:superkiller protein 3
LAVKSRPDDTAALNGLAIAYLQLGRLDQAVERLKEVLLLDPNSSRAHINLAFAMTQMGQYNAAIEHYNAVLVLEPDRPDILSQLAASYAALGDFHRAISVTEKALVVAKNGGNDEVVGQIQKQLDDYKSQLNIQ